VTHRGRTGGGLHRAPKTSQAEEDREKEIRKQLRTARKSATVEVHDGRKWRVLKLPDSFDREKPDTEVKFHRKAAAMWRERIR
jgi:hypothetical protein